MKYLHIYFIIIICYISNCDGARREKLPEQQTKQEQQKFVILNQDGNPNDLTYLLNDENDRVVKRVLEKISKDIEPSIDTDEYLALRRLIISTLDNQEQHDTNLKHIEKIGARSFMVPKALSFDTKLVSSHIPSMAALIIGLGIVTFVSRHNVYHAYTLVQLAGLVLFVAHCIQTWAAPNSNAQHTRIDKFGAKMYSKITSLFSSGRALFAPYKGLLPLTLFFVIWHLYCNSAYHRHHPIVLSGSECAYIAIQSCGKASLFFACLQIFKALHDHCKPECILLNDLIDEVKKEKVQKMFNNESGRAE